MLSKVSYDYVSSVFYLMEIISPTNLEGDVDSVELDLGLLHLDPHLRLEVSCGNSLQLAGSVSRESSSL